MMMWQIFIFVFSIGLVSADRNPLERVKRSVDHVHDIILNQKLRLPLIHQNQNRHKRQVNNWRSVDNDDSSECLLNCAYALKRAAARYQNPDEDESTNANQLMKPKFNLTRLTSVCQAMRPPVQCFDRCPISTLKSQLQTSLEPIRFICIDRYQDFMNNLRCMHKLDTTANSQCTPRCRRFEAAVNKTMQLGRRPSLRHFYSLNELKEMLSGTCSFVQCYMDCSVPLIRSVCGETAAELSSGLIQKMFASFLNYDKLSNGGATNLPASCRRLAQPSGTEVADEDDDTPTFAVHNRNQWQGRSNRGNDGYGTLYDEPEADDPESSED